jgi:hypothetical protein
LERTTNSDKLENHSRLNSGWRVTIKELWDVCELGGNNATRNYMALPAPFRKRDGTRSSIRASMPIRTAYSKRTIIAATDSI